MRMDDDGYMVEMSKEDVRASLADTSLADKDSEGDAKGVWIASMFGPVASHEIVPFKKKGEAYEWILNHIDDNMTLDEMCPDCWKDIYDTGTEYEVRYMELP